MKQLQKYACYIVRSEKRKSELRSIQAIRTAIVALLIFNASVLPKVLGKYN